MAFGRLAQTTDEVAKWSRLDNIGNDQVNAGLDINMVGIWTTEILVCRCVGRCVQRVQVSYQLTNLHIPLNALLGLPFEPLCDFRLM